MKTSSLALMLLLAAGFTAGVVYLFGVRFAAGDVYPEYSSLRSDPRGAKLLYASLARLPGIAATRNFLPLESVEGTGATVILLGLAPRALNDEAGTIQAIEKLAGRGNRVVAAMALDSEREVAAEGKLSNSWHVRLRLDTAAKPVHKLYFGEAKDWNVLESVDGKMLAIERDFGKGSVVLFAESEVFANDSTAATDELELVAAAIGPYARVVFDEAHLGIAEAGSIVGLARRFRLTGMAAGLAICAALFVWRSASGFPPPVERREGASNSGRTSLSGLLTLLRRHIPPSGLAAACWREWLSVNRRGVAPERMEQAAAIARSTAAPLDAMREIQAVLHSKGNL